ncbi:MAG TPA: hypothetical protein VHG90_01845 [Acidimicrobiales bacterium]|nr:hypothetical protein [Acidimicrobiales bacterium]
MTALAAVSMTAALAACGGPTKSGLLSEGDAICRTSMGPVQSLRKPTNYPELSEAARALAAAALDQEARLRELGIPDGDKDEVRPIVSALGGVAASARRLQETAAKTDDRGTSEAVNDATARSKDAAGRARAYGFGTCGMNTEGPVATVLDGAKGIVKAAFVARAEALCREAINQEERLPEPRAQSALPAYLDAVLALEEKVADEMRGLPVPPGDEAAVAELVDARVKLNAKGRELTAAMRARDGRRQAAIVDELAVLGTAAAAKADAYGIRECGTGSVLG